MFLLNHLGVGQNTGIKYTFTFHYVSIKSRVAQILLSQNKNLHSTMFLLNPLDDLATYQSEIYLHSTMFLLNLLGA